MGFKIRPPRLAEWLLSRSLPPADRDVLLGDFAESFTETTEDGRRLSAYVWYWRQVLRSLPRVVIHSFFWSLSMIFGYIKIALRGLRRRKVHALINIGGLAMGIACCLLIFSFVRHERSYDRFHTNAEEIFLLRGRLALGNAAMMTAADLPLGPTLPGRFPEVVETVRLTLKTLIVRKEADLFKANGLAADPSFFRVFSFPLLEGGTDEILNDPQAVVLTEGMARRHFEREDPLGKILSVRLEDEFYDFRVAGVCVDPPGNSSLHFDFILNLRRIRGEELDSWDSGRHVPTFLRLTGRDRASFLEAKFPGTIDARLRESFGENSGYSLQALVDYHFGGGDSYPGLEGQSRGIYSAVLSGIALLVLLIACFNATNTAVAGASTRLGEIGVRKVLGATRRQLLRQFWVESLVTGVSALAAGGLLAGFLLPTFNRLTGKNLALDPAGDARLWPVLLGLTFFVGLVSGGYPALVLSGFHPVALFRSRVRFSGRNYFSRALIVFQFVISIFLLVSTLFLSRQYRFLLEKNPGFVSDRVLSISLDDISPEIQRSRALLPVLKQRLAVDSGVRAVTGSEFGLNLFWASKAPEVEKGRRVLLDMTGVDYDYLETLGIPLLEGRNFSPDYPGDRKDAVIVNRAFLRRFGMTSPIGRRISEPFLQDFPGTIIGVMEDFHYRSLHQAIRPAYLYLAGEGEFNAIYIKLAGSDSGGAIARVEKIFKEVIPEVPFQYAFLDEQVARQYENEARWKKMVNAATVFALLIACSGLFGLTMLTAWRRTKEIGIRKVLGASTFRIVRLLNREFIGLVLAANLLAWPAGYFSLRILLRNYAYRIRLGPDGFLLAAALTALVALLTVSAYALRVGRSDPVEAIQYE